MNRTAENPLVISTVSDEDVIISVAALAEQIWKEHYTPIIGEDQVRYMLDNFQNYDAMTRQINEDGYIYYAAYWEKVLVGYAAAVTLASLSDFSKTNKADKSVYLSKLYVNKDYRRKGISRELVRQVMSDFKPDLLWLTVNKNNAGSISAYKKLGFVITESLVTDIGGGFKMDDYKMALYN
ncbi:MAG: GNAT family N-acetyltransferase [Clostridiales bacterium]|nr:GNAT family N-acetyltransferase [Clostridiales bacterium]